MLNYFLFLLKFVLYLLHILKLKKLSSLEGNSFIKWVFGLDFYLFLLRGTDEQVNRYVKPSVLHSVPPPPPASSTYKSEDIIKLGSVQLWRSKGQALQQERLSLDTSIGYT